MVVDAAEPWLFKTPRLSVGPWRQAAERVEVDLVQALSTMLTDRTTVALPESWRHVRSGRDLRRWVDERDGEATMLLVVESASRAPAGLVVVVDVPVDGAGVDVRLGYLLGESLWGRGMATELVVGIVEWARTRPEVASLTGGVDATNGASIRVLEKCGFRLIDTADSAVLEYRLMVGPTAHDDVDTDG